VSANSRLKIEDFVSPSLMKRRKKLVKQATTLADLDSRSLHKIRIRAKKLRYMAEFSKACQKYRARHRY
jgi:CHAD domain-containing protein